MYGQILPVQLCNDQIHQEGHVVIADLDHGMRGMPAMLSQGGIEHANFGLAGLALLHEVPQADRGTVKIVDQSRSRSPGGTLA